MSNSDVNKLKPVYFLFGDEYFLTEEESLRIKGLVLGGGSFDSMNYSCYYAGDRLNPMDASEVVMVANTLPAFAEKRIVIIKGAESLKATDCKGFLEYVKNPAPSTVLVFLAKGWKVTKTSAFFKAIDKAGGVKQYYTLDDRELLRWVIDYAKKEGKTIASETAKRLLDATGGMLTDIKGELDKLILYVGTREEIVSTDVETSVIDIKEETAFELADAIASRNLTLAFSRFAKLEGEEPLKVLGAVAWQFRILIKVKALLAKGQSGQALARTLRIRGDKVASYTRICEKIKGRELIDIIYKLRQVDTDIKSSGIPKNMVLPRLIIEACAGVGV
ncbi:MAG: DNA polymerase III subunit delta [Deltaproteobacteria bacterium]|nr:DNA polymerase III subunit delta [Deltaproteobacteria bacterium]